RKSVPVKDVCRKLGVKYVLEGNVRKSGPRLRIGTQLIDGVLGSELWSERYDRRLEDVFAVQDDVTGKIVQALEVRLLGDLRAGFPQKPTHNSEAYDYVLRAREQYRFFSQDQNASARELYKNAIALDPSYGEAYAGLAETYVQDWFMGSEPNLERAAETAQLATVFGPHLPLVYEALSTVYLFQREHEKAIEAARKWLRLEPSSADAYAALAGALHFAGANQETILLIERAVRLNPHYPFYYPHYMGMANLVLCRFDRALDLFKRAVNRNPEALWPHVYMASCYGQLGNASAAQQKSDDIRKLNAGFSISSLHRLLPYKQSADAAVLFDGLQIAGLSD
ncbi:MAG: tetratricopeptide repeat protein, partial [Hyphomicrobiaceae bacterium]